LLGLEIDTPVANAAGKVVQTLTGGVSAEAKASVEVLLDSIRGSKMWPTFTKMLQESGVRRFRVTLLFLADAAAVVVVILVLLLAVPLSRLPEEPCMHFKQANPERHSLLVALNTTHGQVSIRDLENSFMFNTGFQSSSAIAKNMEYCIGSLTANPDFLEELRKELDGKVGRGGGSNHDKRGTP